jgi:thiol-disulfide isomerase/thioredoxin
LTMQELRGRVVLIDFWTYTCINCIRTYPHLKAWHSRYSDDGLVIIGVHSPEFEFEADYDNVVEASENDGIIWPVAQDNEFETWRSYSNRYWPAKYLVDEDGVVRYTHFGEGDYAETEMMIRELLLDAGAQLNDGNLPLPSDQMLDPAFSAARDAEITRELYAGYLRGRNDLAFGGGGYVGQDEYYNTRDAVADLQVPDELEPHQIYFEGSWYIGPESSRHGAESTGYEDYLALVYSARSVNAVLTSDSGEPYRVRLTVGGEYLTDENKGADVTIGPDGESYIVVTEPKIYNIIESPEWMRRQELRMSSDSPDFGLFAFTFGSYEKEAS